MSTPLLVQRAGIVRGFNRFYTHQIGVLQEHLLQSDFSLTEIRVMYELSSRGDLTSADLCQMLSLDAGYLSRLISGLEKKGLIQKVRSITDARAVQLHLSDLGRSACWLRWKRQTQQEVMALIQCLARAATAATDRQRCSAFRRCCKAARRTTCCATRNLAIWAWWCSSNRHCMRESTAGIGSSRRWWRRLSPSTCGTFDRELRALLDRGKRRRSGGFGVRGAP